MTSWRDRIGRKGRRVRPLTTGERREIAGMLVGMLIAVTLIGIGTAMTITSDGQRNFGSVLFALGALTLATMGFLSRKPDARRSPWNLALLGLVLVLAVSGIAAYALGR